MRSSRGPSFLSWPSSPASKSGPTIQTKISFSFDWTLISRIIVEEVTTFPLYYGGSEMADRTFLILKLVGGCDLKRFVM